MPPAGAGGILALALTPLTSHDAATARPVSRPQAALDYYQDEVEYPDCAFVYADRGMAVLTDPTRSRLERIYLFAPSTADDYAASHHHPVAPPRGLRHH